MLPAGVLFALHLAGVASVIITNLVVVLDLLFLDSIEFHKAFLVKILGDLSS